MEGEFELQNLRLSEVGIDSRSRFAFSPHVILTQLFFFLGDDPNRIFTVRISNTDNVGMPKKLDQSHHTSQLKDVDAPDVVHLPMSKVSFLTIVDEYIHVICSKGAWYATTIFS